jgi:hypothetical protein
VSSDSHNPNACCPRVTVVCVYVCYVVCLLFCELVFRRRVTRILSLRRQAECCWRSFRTFSAFKARRAACHRRRGHQVIRRGGYASGAAAAFNCTARFISCRSPREEAWPSLTVTINSSYFLTSSIYRGSGRIACSVGPPTMCLHAKSSSHRSVSAPPATLVVK